MKILVKAGKYVVAVSGGVDSMTLLDLLSKYSGVDLVVAHFDHGSRPSSRSDALLVKTAARQYNLPLELGQDKLGAGASEATARKVRYKFLEKVRAKYQADGIITGHHQDDLIETAIINLVRGTGWRGLVAIQNNPKIVRPLLPYTKRQLVTYAQRAGLNWHEDPTNQDQNYLRNLVRHQVLPKLSTAQKAKLLSKINQVDTRAKMISVILNNLEGAAIKNNEIDRSSFVLLPSNVGEELMLEWLRQNGLKEIDRPTIKRLSVAVKSAKAGSRHEAGGTRRLEVLKQRARLL